MGALLSTGFLIILCILVGLVGTGISLFFGHIIIFDSIFLALVSAILSNKLLHIHPAFCLLIGIGIFILLFTLQYTRFGFWIIGIILSLFWALIFAAIALIVTNADLIWGSVVFLPSFIIMIALHIKAKENIDIDI